MVIAGLLTALAKKLLKDKVKKLGRAVYNRTLKPVLEGLKKKAKDYMNKLLRKPLDQKTQRELDNIMQDIETVENERAKLPGGPDVGDGPEIELGAPPKTVPPKRPVTELPPKRGNRLPVELPEQDLFHGLAVVPPEEHGDMFGGFGIGEEPDFSSGVYAVDLEEEMAPFNPEYAKGVPKAEQIVNLIEEQEEYVYGDMMEYMLNNVPLKSDDAVAIRHEVDVEMMERPRAKQRSVWMGDGEETVPGIPRSGGRIGISGS